MIRQAEQYRLKDTCCMYPSVAAALFQRQTSSQHHLPSYLCSNDDRKHCRNTPAEKSAS
jgi:hypothetical protein